MPLDRENKIFFIHIPKTGGTSIENMLGISKPDNNDRKLCKNILFGNVSPGAFWEHGPNCYHHQPLKTLIENELITLEELEEYYKFAFVRNPYDRIISEYYFRNRPESDLNKFIKNIVYKNYQDGKLVNFYYNHLIPQTDFVYYENKLYCDFVGRFENFKEDIEKLNLNLGNKLKDVVHKNKSSKNKKESLDEDSVKIINEIYHEDFINFNYDKL